MWGDHLKGDEDKILEDSCNGAERPAELGEGGFPGEVTLTEGSWPDRPFWHMRACTLSLSRAVLSAWHTVGTQETHSLPDSFTWQPEGHFENTSQATWSLLCSGPESCGRSTRSCVAPIPTSCPTSLPIICSAQPHLGLLVLSQTCPPCTATSGPLHLLLPLLGTLFPQMFT